MTVLSLIMAVKSNNLQLYKHCLFKICDLFFAYDGQNYDIFVVFMKNIEDNHPYAEALLRRGASSVARCFRSGNRCAVDKTIEETLMKNTKPLGGIGSGGAGLSEITPNYNAYGSRLFTNEYFMLLQLSTWLTF